MVRKLSLWIRAHPIVGDSTLALAMVVFDYWFIGATLNAHVSTPWLLLVGLLLIGPLVVRRRWPLASAYAIALGGIVQLATHRVVDSGPHTDQLGAVQLRPWDLALCVALYTLVAYVSRKHGLLYSGLLLLGTAAWALLSLTAYDRSGVAVITFTALLLFSISFIAGEYNGARRAYATEVERRLSLLETERDQQARIAVADERARIARELHDVVAHAVSVIIVQADGAAYAIRQNPELAESAVSTISTTGRTALTELRRLLGVLREDGSDAELAPQPDASGLSKLADQIGLPVRLRLSGDVDGLPTSIGLNVYRIIQEALTNTLKHGGEDVSATVSVHRGEETVELSIEDNGAGAPTEAFRDVDGGNGIIGMRERATMHGGDLEAGPKEHGGWRVTARLPLRIGDQEE